MSLPNLATESTELTQLAQLYQLQNILNAYVVKNILLVNQADEAVTETFINPNLYAVAVKYYSDYTYWTVIYNANKTVLNALKFGSVSPPYTQYYPDPKVVGTVTLLIPPKPSSNVGGGVFLP